MRLILACLIAASLGGTATAQGRPSAVDFQGFAALTGEVASHRAKRLLSWEEFAAKARQPGVLLLDARSADAYAAGHIAGAVNLPFTDFTAESLAEVIGDPDRPVLIYCNNNFANDVAPVMLKRAELALNIQTFINLVGYGYPNIWELADTIDLTNPKVGWVTARTVRPALAPASGG